MIDENILVWIESTSGEIYNEYEYKDPKPGRNECYIESKQSHNFRICWRFRGTTPHSLKAVIWLDGIEVGGGLLQSYQVHHTFRMSGRAIGNSKRLPFVFGKQQLTDDESSSSHLSNPEDLNTIWITFDHVTFIEYTTTPPTPPKHRGAIHEKVAKTAHSDSAGLGDPIHSPVSRWCKTEKVPGTKSVQFVFHYAPLEWLVARGVVSGRSTKRKSPRKDKSTSPEKKRAIAVPPSTPHKHKHTFEELVVDSDSDSDSDVVVVDETSNKSPAKQVPSTPSKSKVQTPSKPRPRPKPNKSEDVIDLASSDDDV